MDDLTQLLIEVRELRAEKKSWEAAMKERELALGLIRMAEQLSGGRKIHHPLVDGQEAYAGLPFSTRLISEQYLKQAAEQVEKQAELAQKAAERQKRHEQFLQKQANAREAEEKRVSGNFEKIIAAGILPETWEAFTNLPSELKTKLLGELGGINLLREYKVKEASGLSWAAWKALIAYDPNAKVVEPETASAAAPPKEPTEGGAAAVAADAD